MQLCLYIWRKHVLLVMIVIFFSSISKKRFLDVTSTERETCFLKDPHWSTHRILNKGNELAHDCPVINGNAIANFAEDYTHESRAVSHVQRLLDIVACTTRFAKPKGGAGGGTESRPRKSKIQQSTTVAVPQDGELRSPETQPSAVTGSYDMVAIHPIPKLSDFYEFFSFSHLTPPILRASVFLSLWLSPLFVVLHILS